MAIGEFLMLILAVVIADVIAYFIEKLLCKPKDKRGTVIRPIPDEDP